MQFSAFLPRQRMFSSLYILFLFSIVRLRAATAYPVAVPCRHQGRHFLVWCARQRIADLEISSRRAAYVGFNALKFRRGEMHGPLLISEPRSGVRRARARGIIMRRIARERIDCSLRRAR